MPRADYQERKEAKIDRLNDRAAKTAAEADALYESGHKALSRIPLGQPILIGHHSEKRDRNFRARNVGRIEKSFELSDKAAKLAGRASAAESNASISSDDPEAIKLLKEKAAGLRERQERMKAMNAAYRKFAKNPEYLTETPGVHPHKSGLSPADRETVRNFTPEHSWQKRGPFESYELSNNNANIRRVEKRIKELEVNEEIVFETIKGDGFEVYADPEDNRIYVDFPGKPSKEVRTYLKRHGFRWTPSVGKWGRLLNGPGRYAGMDAGEWLKENL